MTAPRRVDDDLLRRALRVRMNYLPSDALLARIIGTAAVTRQARRTPRWRAIALDRPLIRLAVLGILAMIAILAALYAGGGMHRQTQASPFVGTEWQLVDVEPSAGIAKQSILRDTGYRIRFGDDGAVLVTMPCGSFRATYVKTGTISGSIEIAGGVAESWSPSLLPMPEGCDDVLTPLYFQMIASTSAWRVDDTGLRLGAPPAGVGIYRDTALLGGRPPSTISPSATPSPRPTRALFSTTAFAAPFTIDAGILALTWRQHLETPVWTYFGYRRATNQDDEGISIHVPDNLAMDPVCSTFDAQPSYGPWSPRSDPARELMDWLQSHLANGPVPEAPVEVGGAQGFAISLFPSDLQGCGEALFVTRTAPDNAFGVPTQNWAGRIVVLNVHGKAVLIAYGTTPPDRLKAMQPDVDTFLALIRFK